MMLAKQTTPIQIRLYRGFLINNEAGHDAAGMFAKIPDDSGIFKGCDGSLGMSGRRVVDQVRMYVYKIGSSLISSLT